MVRDKKEWFRIAEKTIIYVFIALTFLLVLINPSSSQSKTNSEKAPQVTAFASAMPHQGWLPLETYFSAFGSQSTAGDIVKYEWDLDGNGLFDTESTQPNGYTSYTYLKPGEYTVSLKVTDSQGNSSIDTISIKVRHPVSSSVDYWKVFDDSQVRKVEIQISQANWQLMWQDPEAKTEVLVDAIVFGTKLENVGFRMRGQFSLRESKDKKPWKINIDAYKEEQEYENLRQLMFINSIGDPSLLQEKLAYEMMQFAGIPSSHVTYVDLWFDFTDDQLPPVFWGVYSMIERVDKKFLTSNFGRDSKEGNLYKASHAQRGPMDLRYYGDQIENYPTQNGLYAYGKASNEELNDYSDIILLCKTIDGTKYESPEDFAAAAEKVINMDTFL
ncbi:MAG: CotH kinase family protein, partial [Anaerolineaceae bacterium]|nr:CotH kinase family protein [Anaerolineaceae bacterium]